MKLTDIYEMKRNLKYGMVSMCIGGGMESEFLGSLSNRINVGNFYDWSISGSFDLITNGHLNIIERSTKL